MSVEPDNLSGQGQEKLPAKAPGQLPGGGYARISPWAIGALVSSLVVFCPILTMLGPLLALKAFSQIKADARYSGRRLAQIGLVIGLVVTCGWAWGAWWWHGNIRRPMIDGPIIAMQAGFMGDLDGFRAGFTGPGSQESDVIIQAYLNELSSRYGKLLTITQREVEGAAADGYQGRSYQITYWMEFEIGPINAEGRFIITAQGQPGFVARFAWWAVLDDEQGDLIYPASAAKEVRSSALPAAETVIDGN